MSISTYFDTLGKDIANAFNSIGQSTSFNDFISRSTTANNQFVSDLVGGTATVTPLPASPQAPVPVASQAPVLAQAPATIPSPIAIISNGIANAVDATTHAINNAIPATTPAGATLHQINDAINIIAHDGAKTAVAITNSGSVEKIATTAIDSTVNTITDLVTHFDTSASTAAISHAVSGVVDNVTNIVDAGFSKPTEAVHATVQVLDAVSGITTAITDAVVATHDPATLDQQAIAGVKGFADFVHGIDQLPTTIGGGVVTGANQLNDLIHASNPQNPVLGQIGDGLAIVGNDIGTGLSSVLGTSDVAHLVTGSLTIASNTIGDLIAHYDPKSAPVAHTVTGVLADTTHIVDTIYDAVTKGDVLGATHTANEVIGSLTHIGQSIGEQIAHAYTPPSSLLVTPIEQPVIL